MSKSSKSTSSTQPVSEKRLAANRENAKRSTGPRTPEGKARSAQNARKHGFRGAAFAVVRLEDLLELDRLRADLIATYQPVNSQELFALERIALAQQSMLRASRLEAGLHTCALNEVFNRDPDETAFYPMNEEIAGGGNSHITREQNRNYALAEGFRRYNRRGKNEWSLFLRYQAQSERLYRRALEEFERLKRLRAELPNEPITDTELPSYEGDPYNTMPVDTQPEPPPPPPEPQPQPQPEPERECPPLPPLPLPHIFPVSKDQNEPLGTLDATVTFTLPPRSRNGR